MTPGAFARKNAQIRGLRHRTGALHRKLDAPRGLAWTVRGNRRTGRTASDDAPGPFS